MLQFRQQNHAFLFVRIGPCDDGACGGAAGVEGQVGHVGGDVEKIAGRQFRIRRDSELSPAPGLPGVLR